MGPADNRYQTINCRCVLIPALEPRTKTMNPTASVMLIEDSIRPCMVEYDPDNGRNNSDHKFFKCLDPNAKVGDLMIVTTNTRHGMTVAKITKIGVQDVPVNFEGTDIWGWVVGPVPSEQHARILETEKSIVGRVQEANTNKLKAELKAAMGLASVSFADLDLNKAATLAAPAAPVDGAEKKDTEA